MAETPMFHHSDTRRTCQVTSDRSDRREGQLAGSSVRFIAAVFAAAGLLGHCFFPAPLFAQGAGFGNAPTNAVTSFNGKLKGMQGMVVIVEKEDGTPAMVAVPDSISSFQFVASATPAFLRRGMLMRFVADFGPGGVPLSPVGTVTLFQPVDPKSLHGRAREQFTPGVYSQSPDARNRNQPMSGKLTVVGQFAALAPNGILAVQAGRVPVRVPVDANTKLEVRYNNLSLALPGGSVAVSGFYEPPNENQVKADKITVTTDRVYGEYKPEPVQSRRKRGAKDDAADAAAEKKAEDDAPAAEKDAGKDAEKGNNAGDEKNAGDRKGNAEDS